MSSFCITASDGATLTYSYIEIIDGLASPTPTSHMIFYFFVATKHYGLSLYGAIKMMTVVNVITLAISSGQSQNDQTELASCLWNRAGGYEFKSISWILKTCISIMNYKWVSIWYDFIRLHSKPSVCLVNMLKDKSWDLFSFSCHGTDSIISRYT